MHVRDLMSRDVKICRPDETLERAAEIMWNSDCGCVPVVNHDECVVGMITDRDICMAAYTQGQPLWKIRVQNAMSHDVHTCAPDDNPIQAEMEMRGAQVRRLPVVDRQGHVLGVISLNDLARAAARGGHKDNSLSLEGVARTLAAVAEPRSSRTPVTTSPTVSAPAAFIH
jgi:CBS domain-containing protein